MKELLYGNSSRPRSPEALVHPSIPGPNKAQHRGRKALSSVSSWTTKWLGHLEGSSAPRIISPRGALGLRKQWCPVRGAVSPPVSLEGKVWQRRKVPGQCMGWLENL